MSEESLATCIWEGVLGGLWKGTLFGAVLILSYELFGVPVFRPGWSAFLGGGVVSLGLFLGCEGVVWIITKVRNAA
jgi:hypothetical protein